MNNKELLERVLRLVERCGRLEYRGMPLSLALKVPLHTAARNELIRRGKPGARLRDAWGHTRALVFRLFVLPFLGLLRGLRGPADSAPITGKSVFVCDFAGHVEQMTQDLSKDFDKERICLVTANPGIAERLGTEFPNRLNAHPRIFPFRWGELAGVFGMCRRLWRCFPEKTGLLFKFSISLDLIAILQAADYYHDLFRRCPPAHVITICDAHWHEFVVTWAAKACGIPTYTNQHGEFADMIDYVPVISDKIFIWGEMGVGRLVEHGVPEEKIVISGNPKFDRVYGDYLPRREELRERFARRFGPGGKALTLCFLSSGMFSTSELDEASAFRLFRCFCRAASLPVRLVAKLHPNQDHKPIFQAWLKRQGLEDRVSILQDENLYEILAITDIAVTFHSTSGLEAIGYGIPTIVLSIFKGVDLRRSITYLEDSIVCRSEEEYVEVLSRLVNKTEFLTAEQERTNLAKKRHFRNQDGFQTSRFIRDYVMGVN